MTNFDAIRAKVVGKIKAEQDAVPSYSNPEADERARIDKIHHEELRDLSDYIVKIRPDMFLRSNPNWLGPWQMGNVIDAGDTRIRLVGTMLKIWRDEHKYYAVTATARHPSDKRHEFASKNDLANFCIDFVERDRASM